MINNLRLENNISNNNIPPEKSLTSIEKNWVKNRRLHLWQNSLEMATKHKNQTRQYMKKSDEEILKDLNSSYTANELHLLYGNILNMTVVAGFKIGLTFRKKNSCQIQ